MELPFNSHAIYITLDDDELYEVKSDFSKIKVDDILVNQSKPSILLHKAQFEAAKGFLLDIENPFRLKNDDAKLFNKLGFLSDSDFNNYISKGR